MTLSEFKAWFEGFTEGLEGFTEGLEGAPTEKQFERIKGKVAEITGTPITYPVFIDRYRDYKWPGQFGYPYTTYSAGAVGQGVGNAVLVNSGHAALMAGSQDAVFSGAMYEAQKPAIAQLANMAGWSGEEAMYAVGRADALQ